MVMPVATDDLCPQCGADVRAAGTRCKSCGFYLPARPAPRTGPPTARPRSVDDRSRKVTIVVLAVGGAVVLGLLGIGVAIATRSPSNAGASVPAVVKLSAVPSAALPRSIEPSVLLAEARRRASSWHRESVLTLLRVEGLEASGVAPSGVVTISYSVPSASKITGGAETSVERLTLVARGEKLSTVEERATRGRVVPEPNCLFEEAWTAAKGAGVDPNEALSMVYTWSEKHERPLWEVSRESGEVLKRVDGVSCTILTR